MGFHYKDNAWKSAWAGNSTPSVGSHPFKTAAAKGLRTLQYIWIEGIFTENCVCLLYSWEGAGETGSSGHLWGGEVDVKGAEDEKESLFTAGFEF